MFRTIAAWLTKGTKITLIDRRGYEYKTIGYPVKEENYEYKAYVYWFNKIGFVKCLKTGLPLGLVSTLKVG